MFLETQPFVIMASRWKGTYKVKAINFRLLTFAKFVELQRTSTSQAGLDVFSYFSA